MEMACPAHGSWERPEITLESTHGLNPLVLSQKEQLHGTVHSRTSDYQGKNL